MAMALVPLCKIVFKRRFLNLFLSVPNIGDTITLYEYVLVYCADLNTEDQSAKADYLRAIKKTMVYAICEQLFGETIDASSNVVKSRVPKRAGGVEIAALFLQWARQKVTLFLATKALSDSHDPFYLEVARLIQVNTRDLYITIYNIRVLVF